MKCSIMDRLIESKAVKTVFALVLALGIAMPTTLINLQPAYAEEDNQVKVTFNVAGNGEITLTDANDQEITVSAGESKEITQEEGTYVHVKGETSGTTSTLERFANNGETELGGTDQFEGNSFETDITFAGPDTNMNFTLGQEPVAPMSLAANISPRSSSEPYVGEVFTGGFRVKDLNQPGGPGHTVLDLTVGDATGVLSELGDFKLYCADHGSADPSRGAWFEYQATVTSINTDSGEVRLSIWAWGTGEFTHEDGYQRIQGSASIWRDFGGWIELDKDSSNTSISDNNACYSLEGAQYGIFSDSGCTNQVATLTTNADGYAKSDKLKSGNYWVKETKQAPGFALDSAVYPVTIKAGQTAKVNGDKVYDAPQNDPAGILIAKFDGEYEYLGEANLPQGAASLAGAEFTVTYYDGQYSTVEDAKASGDPTRSWTFATDNDGVILLSFAEDYLVSGDPLYYDANGYTTLPLGTVLIQETKAPTGYNLNDEIFIRQITTDGTLESVNTYNTPEVPDQVRRGDLEFSKRDGTGMNNLAHVPFKITAQSTGESHIVFTDENGYFSTSSSYNAHTNDTNGNDDAYTEGTDWTFTEANYNAEAGTWFGMNTDGETTAPNDDLGALPYDTYSIQELPCEANEGLQLINDLTVVVSRDSNTVDLGTLDDPPATLASVATDNADGDKYVVADANSRIHEALTYAGVIEGKQGTVKAELVDTDDNNKVLATVDTDFTSKLSGVIDIYFDVDTSKLAGHHLAIKDTLTIDGRTIATHNEDFSEADQMVEVIQTTIKTQAKDYDGDQTVVSSIDSNFSDTVTIHNAIVGETYTVEASVIYTDSGEPYLVDGNEVKATTEFVAEDTTCTATVNFEGINTLELAGQKVTLIEHLYHNGNLVTEEVNKDITEQQLEIVETTVGTTATDMVDGDKTVAGDDKAQIKDTVAYSNAIVDGEYRGLGIVMDLTTHLPMLFGEGAEEVTHEELQAFTDALCDALGVDRLNVVPEESKDSTDNEGGATPSLAENLGDIIGDLMGGNTTDDTTDNESGENTDDSGYVDENQTTLNFDKTHEIDWGAVDQVFADNEKVVSHLAYASQDFVADRADGSFDMVFNTPCLGFDQSDAVVFELLTLDNFVVAGHMDFTSEEQTVVIQPPSIGTTLTDATDGDHYFLPSTNTQLVDTVSHTGLVPGQTYTFVGTLYDKATGEPILVNDQVVTSTVSITVNNADGTVDVPFEFDSTGLADGDTVVAFEQVYKDGDEPIAVHEDINDEEQACTIGVPPEGEVYDKTGQTILGAVIVCALLAAAGGYLLYRYTRDGKEETEQE